MGSQTGLSRPYPTDPFRSIRIRIRVAASICIWNQNRRHGENEIDAERIHKIK